MIQSLAIVDESVLRSLANLGVGGLAMLVLWKVLKPLVDGHVESLRERDRLARENSAKAMATAEAHISTLQEVKNNLGTHATVVHKLGDTLNQRIEAMSMQAELRHNALVAAIAKINTEGCEWAKVNKAGYKASGGTPD